MRSLSLGSLRCLQTYHLIAMSDLSKLLFTPTGLRQEAQGIGLHVQSDVELLTER